jgi:hypothetical protein
MNKGLGVGQELLILLVPWPTTKAEQLDRCTFDLMFQEKAPTRTKTNKGALYLNLELER